MKIAIFSRSGPCFPNVISQGLTKMLDELGIKSRIFYDGIPMLMRLLPLKKKQKRWHTNYQFRIRNKIYYYFRDRRLINELNKYDALIISECYGNAFWKNYFAVEELKQVFHGKLISYTESPLDAAPNNKKKEMDADDFNEDVYDFNLFVTRSMEVRAELNVKQAEVGVNIINENELNPKQKREFIAVLDFAKTGYEVYRKHQIIVLNKLGVKTIVLEGRYPIEEIRKIYSQAAVFFLSFPETFGLPIAECLACGTYVFTPESAWPMSWRLNETLVSDGPGDLPECFQVYSNDSDLEEKLVQIIKDYNVDTTPMNVVKSFLRHYDNFYHGNKAALQGIIDMIN